MINNARQFHLQRELFQGTISLRIAVRRNDGERDIATSITFEKMKQGEFSDPLLHLEVEEAQNLADQLYAVGIRPSAAAGSAGQLDAVKYHLEDLRTLVFKGTKP